MRHNPRDLEAPKKAYAHAQTMQKMDINQFAEHISTHGCVYSRADIAAVLTLAVDCLRENLLNGVLIKLGDLGDFSVGLQCTGADKVSDFKADVNIIGVSANWTPGPRFTNMLADATFQAVPSRKVARLLMKAIKAGETSVDFSEEEEDGDLIA